MAKTKVVQRDKSKKAGASSSKSSAQGVRSSDKEGSASSRMRKRKKSAPELYKTRHNIGKRSAAGGVASYKESEVALLFPDGFFRPVVKMEMEDKEGENTDQSERHGPSHKNTKEDLKANKDTTEQAETTGSKKQSTKACSVSPQGKGKDGSKSIVKRDKAQQKITTETKTPTGKSAAETSSNANSTSEKGKLVKGKNKSGDSRLASIKELAKKCKTVSKQTKESEKSASSSPVRQGKETVKEAKSSSTPQKRKDIDFKKDKKSQKKSKGAKTGNVMAKTSKFFGLQPRAPRIKRTACLNAGAIMSAMYRDEPIIKKPKMEQATTSNHEDSDKTDSESTESKQLQNQNKQDLDKSESPKKGGCPKKSDSPKKKDISKGKARPGAKTVNKVVKMDIGKKVKVKMKAKEKIKAKPKVIRKKKKVVTSSEESSESEEEDIPLWPPPRRMASLNAQAILAASCEERTPRPRAEPKPKSPKKQVSEPQEQSPTVENNKEKEEAVSPAENCQKAEVKKAAEESPNVTSASQVSSPPPAIQPPPPVVNTSPSQATGQSRLMSKPELTQSVQPVKPNLPNQSPDLQILEVKPPSFSGALVSRPNTGNYSSHSTSHPRPGQGPVPFMPSSSSSFNYAIPSGHSSHGNQGRYSGPPVQQVVPPHAGGYPIQHQAQRGYATGHMSYHSQTHGAGMMQARPQHGTQKLYGQGHPQQQQQLTGSQSHPQGQHLSQSHPQYPGHQPSGHQPPMPSQSQTPFQQRQQQQQQQQQGHHPQMPAYQTSLTPHSSQTPLSSHTQPYHHQAYPMQSNHPRAPMPVADHHNMGPSGYPTAHPTGLTKPKLEPPCSTPGPRFQAIGPKPEKPLTSYPTMSGSQGGSSQQGSGHNQPHGPSPMGNTCTYPYPHSNSQSDQCQSYMMSSVPVDNSATYTMMSFRHYGNAFALHSFDEQQQEHTTFGKGFYQPAGPLIQTMPHDPCCMPEHMAMLVPRPQVKVLVHNTGSYPPTYAPLPITSQNSAMPAKPVDIQPLHQPSPKLKDKSRLSASPLKSSKDKTEQSMEDPDRETSSKEAKKTQEEDGKVFTTLEVATKKPKNANGRELLAQRTKISSENLLMEPIISKKSTPKTVKNSEGKANDKEPTAPAPSASSPTIILSDQVKSAAQTNQSDKISKASDKKLSKKDVPKVKSKKKDVKSVDKDMENKTVDNVLAKINTTTAATMISSRTPTTTSAINSRAQISSNVTTVVASSTSTNKGSAKSGLDKGVKTSVCVSIAPKVSNTLSVQSVASSGTIGLPVNKKQSTPAKSTAKKAKSTKEEVQNTPNPSSSAVSLSTGTSAVVTNTAVTTTVATATKATSTEPKANSRKRKSTTTTTATSTATTQSVIVTSTSTESTPKSKIKSTSKSPGSKKPKLSVNLKDGKTANTTTTTLCKGSVPTARTLPKPPAVPLSSLDSIKCQMTPTLMASNTKTTPGKNISKSVQPGITASALTAGTTTILSMASNAITTSAKVVTTTTSVALTQTVHSAVQKSGLDIQTSAPTIMPTGTLLLSNNALNQPLLMGSSVSNPGQLASGHLPMVSMTAGQIVTPMFLTSKAVTSTTSTTVTPSSTVSASTTVTAGTILPGNMLSQARMPFIQGQFPVTLSGVMPPVFLSIPQPNSMGQTFLHLGTRPTLQQLQLPLVPHQQVMVSQGTQSIAPISSQMQRKTDVSATVSTPSATAQSKATTSVQSLSDNDAMDKDGAKMKKPGKKKVTPKAELEQTKSQSKNKSSPKSVAKKTATKAKDKKTSTTTSVNVTTTVSKPNITSPISKASVLASGVTATTTPVPCSSPPTRASTAPLLVSTVQTTPVQGKTAISLAELSKNQTPLEMLQTVARRMQQIEAHAKNVELLKATDVAHPSRSASTGCVERLSTHMLDQSGALDLVMPSGSSPKCSKGRSSRATTPKGKSTKGNATTPAKVPSRSLSEGAARTPPTALEGPPKTPIRSPPVSHTTQAFPQCYTSPASTSSKLDKAGSSYEDLIQDLSMPRQQAPVTPSKLSGAKDNKGKRDPGTPIDLSKSKKIKECSPTKSETMKKPSKRQPKNTPVKQAGTKSKTLSSSASSGSKSHSKAEPAAQTHTTGYKIVAGIKIPIVEKKPVTVVHSSVGTSRIQTGMATPKKTSKSSKVQKTSPAVQAVVAMVSPIRTVDTSIPLRAENLQSPQTLKTGQFTESNRTEEPRRQQIESQSMDKPVEKITPTKGPRGLHLSEVVQRLHQANKDASDNSDRSDNECSNKSKEDTASTSICQPMVPPMSGPMRAKSGGEPLVSMSTINKSVQGNVSKNKSEIDGKSTISVVETKGDHDDSEDEDALFIDMDCDPSQNKPSEYPPETISPPANDTIVQSSQNRDSESIEEKRNVKRNDDSCNQDLQKKFKSGNSISSSSSATVEEKSKKLSDDPKFNKKSVTKLDDMDGVVLSIAVEKECVLEQNVKSEEKSVKLVSNVIQENENDAKCETKINKEQTKSVTEKQMKPEQCNLEKDVLEGGISSEEQSKPDQNISKCKADPEVVSSEVHHDASPLQDKSLDDENDQELSKSRDDLIQDSKVKELVMAIDTLVNSGSFMKIPTSLPVKSLKDSPTTSSNSESCVVACEDQTDVNETIVEDNIVEKTEPFLEEKLFKEMPGEATQPLDVVTPDVLTETKEPVTAVIDKNVDCEANEVKTESNFIVPIGEVHTITKEDESNLDIAEKQTNEDDKEPSVDRNNELLLDKNKEPSLNKNKELSIELSVQDQNDVTVENSEDLSLEKNKEQDIQDSEESEGNVLAIPVENELDMSVTMEEMKNVSEERLQKNEESKQNQCPNETDNVLDSETSIPPVDTMEIEDTKQNVDTSETEVTRAPFDAKEKEDLKQQLDTETPVASNETEDITQPDDTKETSDKKQSDDEIDATDKQDDTEEIKNKEETEDSRETKDTRKNINTCEPDDTTETENIKETDETCESEDSKETEAIKEIEDAGDVEEMENIKETKDSGESDDTKATDKTGETNDIMETEDPKNSTDLSSMTEKSEASEEEKLLDGRNQAEEVAEIKQDDEINEVVQAEETKHTGKIDETPQANEVEQTKQAAEITEEADKSEESKQAEEVMNAEEGTKPEEAMTAEEAKDAEEVMHTDEATKPEGAIEVEEAKEAEKAMKVEETTKPEEAIKVEEAKLTLDTSQTEQVEDKETKEEETEHTTQPDSKEETIQKGESEIEHEAVKAEGSDLALPKLNQSFEDQNTDELKEPQVESHDACLELANVAEAKVIGNVSVYSATDQEEIDIIAECSKQIESLVGGIGLEIGQIETVVTEQATVVNQDQQLEVQNDNNKEIPTSTENQKSLETDDKLVADESNTTELTIICEDSTIAELDAESSKFASNDSINSSDLSSLNPSTSLASSNNCSPPPADPGPKRSPNGRKSSTEKNYTADADQSPRRSPNNQRRNLTPTSSPKSTSSLSPNSRTAKQSQNTKEQPGTSSDNPRRAASAKHSPNNVKKSPDDNPRRTSPRVQAASALKKDELSIITDETPKKTQSGSKRKDEAPNGSPPAKKALVSPKRKDDKKAGGEQKKSSPSARKREEKIYKPWRWEGEPVVMPVYTQVEGPPISMLCYPAMRHDDGDLICLRDCVLVKSGPRKSDIPYVAKIGALFENSETKEMMMSVLWYYRAEHTETERLPQYIDSEIFASKHRDIIPAVCIDDKCYVLTFNEYCRYRSEQKRALHGYPPRDDVIPTPDLTELSTLPDHMPPLTASTETVFLSRRVYDFKLKRVLKNPQVHVASHQSG